VVFFRVVDNDVVNGVEVDLRAQVLHKLAAEFMIDGINQYVFAFTDEIAVVAAAAQRLYSVPWKSRTSQSRCPTQ
jgi:hypothetical protein